MTIQGSGGGKGLLILPPQVFNHGLFPIQKSKMKNVQKISKECDLTEPQEKT